MIDMTNEILWASVLLAVGLMSFFISEKYRLVAKVLSVLAFIFIGSRYVVIMLGCLFSCRSADLPWVLITVVGLATSATVLMAWPFVRDRFSRRTFFVIVALFVVFSIGKVSLATGGDPLRFTDSSGDYVYAPIKYTYEGGSVEHFTVFDKTAHTWSEYTWGERNAQKEITREFVEMKGEEGFYTLIDIDGKVMIRVPLDGGMSEVSAVLKEEWKPYKLMTKIKD